MANFIRGKDEELFFGNILWMKQEKNEWWKSFLNWKVAIMFLHRHYDAQCSPEIDLREMNEKLCSSILHVRHALDVI